MKLELPQVHHRDISGHWNLGQGPTSIQRKRRKSFMQIIKMSKWHWVSPRQLRNIEDRKVRSSKFWGKITSILKFFLQAHSRRDIHFQTVSFRYFIPTCCFPRSSWRMDSTKTRKKSPKEDKGSDTAQGGSFQAEVRGAPCSSLRRASPERRPPGRDFNWGGGGQLGESSSLHSCWVRRKLKQTEKIVTCRHQRNQTRTASWWRGGWRVWVFEVWVAVA